MAKVQTASQAVEEARQRRSNTAAGKSKRTKWFIKEVSRKVTLTLEKRVRLATEYLRNVVVQNISKPVTKISRTTFTGRKVTFVTGRSRPGEFPRADTTQLMKTIFGEVRKSPKGAWEGYVGTPLDYGVELELLRDRSFLVRSLEEERDKITRLLTGPIRS